MQLTLLPAGTTQNKIRDEQIIQSIEKIVYENNYNVNWAAQINIGKEILEKGGGELETIETIVRRQLKQSERLSRLDELYLNSEVGLQNREHRVKVNLIVRDEIIRQTMLSGKMIYPSGMYVSVRYKNDGTIGSPLAWGFEAYKLPFPYCCIRGYLDENSLPHIEQSVAWSVLNGMEPALYISGQFSGDGDLISPDMLMKMLNLYQSIGIRKLICWCNINTINAVNGIRNVLSVFNNH